jgi:hypothetical protein
LAYAGVHARASAKSCKLGVYDSGGTCYMSCSYRSCVPCAGGGTRCGMLGVLRARICRALASVLLLVAAVLWLGTTSSDSFGDPTYRNLHNHVQSLHGD